MKVDILCSDVNHPAWKYIAEYAINNSYGLHQRMESLTGGDFLFLLSCTEVIPKEVRDRYRHALVLHESDLPKGRGWSPQAWQILEGKNRIPISLIEADDPVDSGAVWERMDLVLEGHELAKQIHYKSFRVKASLMDVAMEGSPDPAEQEGEATYYPRRTKDDSRIDPEKTIAEQFDLLRICDSRFPAFFDFRGHRYIIGLHERLPDSC